MAKNPFIRNIKQAPSKPLDHQSAGILDDFAIRKSIQLPITEGSVLFADSSGGITEDKTNFFWDNTNKKLRIGIQLSLNGASTNIITATNVNGDLRLGAGGGTNDLKIDKDGNVDIFEKLTVGKELVVSGTGDSSFVGKLLVNSDSTGIALELGNGSNLDSYIKLRKGTGAAMIGYELTPTNGLLLQSGAGKNISLQVNSNNFGGGTIAVTILAATGNIGIGTATPNANAILDVSSTTKAFMPPRMTTTQRNNIASPTAGMQIYNTTTNVMDFYNGSAWGAI